MFLYTIYFFIFMSICRGWSGSAVGGISELLNLPSGRCVLYIIIIMRTENTFIKLMNSI